MSILSKLFGKEKIKVEATTLAGVLINEMVINAPSHLRYYNSDFHLDADAAQRFTEKEFLYHIATILVALEAAGESRNPKFSEVFDHIKNSISPTFYSLDSLHIAGQNMIDFFSNKGKKKDNRISWVRAWLQDIGINETNPVRIELFINYWLNYYIAILKSLEELDFYL